jgi:diaminopimelate decarboxylase
MNMFQYRDGILHAEGVSVAELAARHGTPLYVYSRGHMRACYRALAAALAAVDPLICYSVKANSNSAVLRTFLELGAGFDIVSGGELFRARRAGADPSTIVFAGVGKTRAEIEFALREGIRFFTVESEPEAERISQCAAAQHTVGRIAFRVNPDVDPQTHQYISTGKKENKFGLDIERAGRACERAAALPNLELVGLHMHIGSQILSSEPFAEALQRVREVCVRLKERHPTFRCLDVGGGLGISYRPEEDALDPADYAASVLPLLDGLDLEVLLEPGRSLVGNAGILVTRVQYVKEGPGKPFVVTDAGMNDLIRPSLYQAHHEISAVRATDRTVVGDLVGPICESGDFFAADRALPAVGEGDLLALRSAGAYGYTMASTYNSRPLPAEVMVNGDCAVLVSRRGTWEDLVRLETEPGEAG